MSRWRQIQQELIQRAIRGEKLDIVQQDISIGRVHGTVYHKRDRPSSKGILLIHGISGNRYGLGVLAERLAEYGFFCLSIDLPSHYLNPSKLTMGELSETITDGIQLLKRDYGMRRVAIIGHSIGALGAIFSNAGYTIAMERDIYRLWEEIMTLLERHGEMLVRGEYDETRMHEIFDKIEDNYALLKAIIFKTLKHGIERNTDVTCYILLAPPLSVKTAMPGLRILRRLKHSWIKRIITTTSHRPLIAQGYKEGNPTKYVPSDDPDLIEMQFFKTKDAYEFLDYLLHAKEPMDLLQLVDAIVAFKHKDEQVSFFEYYQKNYLLNKPKLFIYGTRDLLLKPFMPFMTSRLEKFYRSCGNAEIYHGAFSHVMMQNPNQMVAAVAIKNERVTERIFRFLDKNI